MHQSNRGACSVSSGRGLRGRQGRGEEALAEFARVHRQGATGCTGLPAAGRVGRLTPGANRGSASSGTTGSEAQEWALEDSNLRPLQCECHALPTELNARPARPSILRWAVGVKGEVVGRAGGL